ncbi:EDD domain protein, DegV family [Virgibacillus subterraneus]|uniref:EDD domain protein, DegV family n=2 Tax=Virgibacillus TaxID=84406 RepID=A0A1H1EGQ2_9BACI|nr:MULTISPECIES: DegV family protein [Virgibacillus]SDQ87740.1 EDD domain protein, DegV family [Virgibacillus salinus]SEQ43023.1 EDD domain protein, DegV family [Virgibacillus subterraneus]
MSIKILADSACDLSKEHYNEYDIEMVSLTVHLDENEFADGREIKPKAIYDAMREEKSPKTSQVAPQSFKTIFTSYAESNQPLIYLALSSELSGTYQTAKMMEQEVKETYPDASIHVIDTKCVSIGLGLIVLRAAELAKDGASVDEIIETATYHAEHMEHIFTVDDLEYLYRGGRVSKTAAFVGTLLKIKPILHVENGKLVPLEKIRGSKKLLNRMLEIMEERGTDFTNQTIGISHGDDLETAEKYAEMFKDKFGAHDIVIEMVGSAIGSHAGPGTIAIFFLNKEYK